MISLNIYKKFKQFSIGLSAAGIVAFSQANDFITHPNYEAFKTKTMQNYGLTAQQVDWAMQGSKNLPNIVNIMNRPGESKPWYEFKHQRRESTICLCTLVPVFACRNASSRVSPFKKKN